MRLPFAKALTGLYISSTAILPAQGSTIDFENQVLPILEENCMDCHGPDKQKSGFRLDQRPYMLKGGDHGLNEC